MKYSIGLLKPDCLKRGIEKEILAMIRNSGFIIIEKRRVRLTREDVDTIWNSCKKTYFYEDMVKFFLSEDCIIFIVEGENAILRLNELVGYFEPALADSGTIRNIYGISAMENIIHSTLNEETYLKELFLFFGLSAVTRKRRGMMVEYV